MLGQITKQTYMKILFNRLVRENNESMKDVIRSEFEDCGDVFYNTNEDSFILQTGNDYSYEETINKLSIAISKFVCINIIKFESLYDQQTASKDFIKVLDDRDIMLNMVNYPQMNPVYMNVACYGKSSVILFR